ncbi:5-formyltetrahydrofolate cyclo-ligase [Pseudomonadota bacterium]|nr:5-formyltetrahydrofolate cyclo-ligase [Pseudomonadota bacterium]
MKTKYRQSILRKRNALGLSEVSNLSKIILRNADLELRLSAIKTLGSYFSSNNEVDLETLANIRLKKNLLTTFPRVEPNHSMSLIAPKNFKKLSKNKYNIFEPTDGDEINPIDHEIIIIPTVGVDKNGYRLGYGGGYYDRFLESVAQSTNRPLLIGLIYDFQFIDESLNELHDIKLDIVFSEQQSKKFS